MPFPQMAEVEDRDLIGDAFIARLGPGNRRIASLLYSQVPFSVRSWCTLCGLSLAGHGAFVRFHPKSEVFLREFLTPLTFWIASA